MAQATFKLNPELRLRVDDAIVQRVKDAVADSVERDDDILRCRAALEGTAPDAGNAPWPGACTLEDPLTRELHTSVVASMVSELRNPPFWIVQPGEDGIEDKCPSVERWLTDKANQCKWPEAVYKLAYNAAAYQFSVCYVGWKEEVQITHEARFEEIGTGIVLKDQDRDPNLKYRKRVLRKEQPLDGMVEYRTIDPWDFYLYPATAQSVEGALAVIERVYMTAEDLLQGVKDGLFDADVVDDLVAAGPDLDGMLQSYKQEHDEDQGEHDSTKDGFYECYVVTGRMPLLVDDGEVTMPSKFLGFDWVWWVCPRKDSGYVLSMKAQDLPIRPYVVTGILPKPGRLMGESVPSMTMELQEQATANIRLMINGANLEMAPMLLVPKMREREFDKFQTYPGNTMTYQNDPGEIQPFQWNTSGPQMGMQLQEYLHGRASQVVAAQGVSGMLSGKVRRAAEVEFTANIVEQKADLFLQNFQMGLENVARLMIMYYVMHALPTIDPETGEERPLIMGPDGAEMTQDILDKRFRFVPHAATGASDPQSRLKLTQAKAMAQQNYFVAAMQLPPNLHLFAWYGAMRQLEDLGEREPEKWIGPAPSQQNMMQPQMMGGPNDAGGGQGAGMVPGQPGPPAGDNVVGGAGTPLGGQNALGFVQPAG